MLKVIRSETDKVTSDEFALCNILAQEVLARGHCVRMKGRGFSMYPFIRNGDTLIIEPKSAAELNIGDVILYRRPEERYVVHRLIRRKSSANLITKGDYLNRCDAPVHVEQVMGRVIVVERDGHYRRLDSSMARLAGRILAKISPTSPRIRPVFRAGWKLYQRFSRVKNQGLFEFFIVSIQGMSLYGRIVKRLRTNIDMKEADEKDVQQALHWLHPKGTTTENYSGTWFVAKNGCRVVGCVRVVESSERRYYPYDGHWLHNVMTRPLYRRMGIGEELIYMTMENSKKKGAKELSLLIARTNYRAIKFYRKLGFKIKGIPAEDKRRYLLGKKGICLSVTLQ